MSDARADQRRLIDWMLEGDFCPHRTSAAITLIQTHISYVLLTGDFAYKIKKPVNLGFLDFSTLQRRKHFCEEEVRLNRRGAPDVYLDVETISQQGDGFCIGGSGAPVEYAVKMRQLPQDGLFSNLLASGQLGPELIQKLAGTIAAYHATAPASAHITQFGMPDRVRKAIDNNYGHTMKFVGGLQTREQFDQTKAFTDRFFAESGQLLTRRVAGNCIRDCHGDLHLGNICLHGDEILLFDCIEFDESFRCVDVIHDAAFAAMDLQASGRADLATLLVNTYAEQTGDWEGLQLLRLYLCGRAYVRAKVNSLRSDDSEASGETRETARKTAADYYRLAWEYSRPQQGQLILVSGLSGSGKSTLARRLAQETGAIHIRSDAVRKHLAGIPLDQKGGDSLYAQPMTDRTYARLLDLGLLLAGRGFTVLLDAKYDRHAPRRQALERARSAALPLRIIHCVAPDHVIRDRLASRSGDISDATVELLDRQRQVFDVFDELEQPHVTVIDTTQGDPPRL